MNNMKLSLSNIAWEAELNREMYTFMHSEGFTGLEIAPGLMFGSAPYDNISSAVRIAKELRNIFFLSVISMQSLWYGRTEKIFESRESRKSLSETTLKAINLANAVECPIMVFGSPANRVTDDEGDIAIAYDFFGEIGEYAYQNGVSFCIEPNPVIYGTNFLNTTREALDFCKELKSKGIYVNLDFGTVIYNQEPLDYSADDLRIIKHIHISEPKLVPIKPRDEHKALKKILEDNRYTGYISVEMAKTEQTDDIYAAAEYLKEVFA